MGINVGIVEVGVALGVAADVVEVGGEIGRIDAHVDLLRGLVGSGEEAGAVVLGFLDRGVDGQSGIEDTEAAVRETAAPGVEMRESGHDRRGDRKSTRLNYSH